MGFLRTTPIMRKLLLLLILLAVLLPAQKSVHVRTYTRKDGTVVQAHERPAPGAKATLKKTPTVAAPAKPLAPIVRRDAQGRIARSATAKRRFEASHACPSTGKTTGPCPGYVVDHVKPLACGGMDAPSNMSWQTVAAAKQKDRWERSGCAAGR